jgi:uncharacterized repeat protein (TIGR01451 family)
MINAFFATYKHQISKSKHLWAAWCSTLCATSCIALITPQISVAQCGTIGKDGTATAISGVLNTYYPGSGTTSNKTVTVGTMRSGGGSAIAAGDLILVIQMQDGSTTNFTNSLSYGGGLNSSVGNYEYAKVDSVSGSTLTLTKNLTNIYVQGTQKTFQVIRIPQYVSATLGGSVTASPWDGSSGGIVAIDVYNNLDFNSKTIDVTGKGFRGGGSRDVAYWYNSPINRTVPTIFAGAYTGTNDFYANNKLASFKGEGTAGTPQYTYDGTTLSNTGVEGYPQGDLGRGAPGNAGGGGVVAGVLNQTTTPYTIPGHDAGGGGGGNIGAGGLGGDTWEPATGGRWPNGGFGGSGIAASSTKILLGGGGGAGITTNSTQMVGRPAADGIVNGGPGGGIVLVRAGNILGNGFIFAQGVIGTKGNSTDAGGGGGAGGSVSVAARGGSFAGLNIIVSGGNGSDSTYREHGPGGGGGGGLVAYGGGATGTPVSTTVSGGAAGFDLSEPPYHHGSMPGFDGGIISSLVYSGCTKTKLILVKRITAINGQPILGVVQDSDNDRDPNWPSATYLRGAIDAGKVKPGDELEYTIYYLNTGNGSAKNVRVCDRLSKNLIFQTQFDSSNSATVDKGISWNPGNTGSQYLTNIEKLTIAANDDKGFFSTTTLLPTNCNFTNNIDSSDNVVVVDLADSSTALPGTITPGTPPNSYGHIRFKAKVKS